MFMFRKAPVYNLSVVIRETGLKADVLRAWERRYELPAPRRSEGGHRLYSQQDIETLKWLKARQAEGLSISRAVELWKSLVNAGRSPLEEAAELSNPALPFLVEEQQPGDLRKNWLDACLAFDEISAENVLNRAFAAYPLQKALEEILLQGLNQIGRDWYAGKITVQQEHFASAIAVRRLNALITAAPLPTRLQSILLGCPAGEWHTIPALTLNLLLRWQGLKVVYLGADITIGQMQETVAAIQPALVVLAAQQLTSAAMLQGLARALDGVVLAYGGLIFNRIPALRERIPAYFLGESLETAIETVEQLLTAPAFYPQSPLADSHPVAAGLHREKQHQIALGVSERLQTAHLPIDFLEIANAYFSAGLSAALELGEPSFLEADLDWARELLAVRQVPAARLISYLTAYASSVHVVMGNEGKLIVDWLEGYIARVEAAS